MRADPSPTPTPPTASASTTAPPPPDAAEPARRASTGRVVSVLALCSVGTYHRKRRALRFLLINETARPLRILSVRPVLPPGGLRPAGTTMVRDCYRWERGGEADVLAPRASIAVTMQFRLPRRCPAPLPVQVRARVRGTDGPVRSEVFTLPRDLGGLDFDTCD